MGMGLNLTGLGLPGLTNDLDGNPRPATGPWTAGAYILPMPRRPRANALSLSNKSKDHKEKKPMRIVDVREITQPISSPIRNAYIDFTKMTTSLVAVITDVVRDGKPVVGYGFNSNGRYGQGGLIRERFRGRILEADPRSLLDDARDNIDPAKIWATMMMNEKPGGHGERSVAVGTLDMAIWDATAKIEGKPLFRMLAERHGREANPSVFVYAAGGYYYPGKDNSALQAEMRGYLDRGYNVVKMKIGGASIQEDRARIEAVLKEIGSQAQLAVDANGRFDLETGIAYAKMLRDYPLFWYEEIGDPLDYALQAAMSEFYPGAMATGEKLFSHQDARNLLRYGGMRPDRDWLQFDCALSYGLVDTCGHLRCCTSSVGRRRAASRTAGTRCHL